MKQCDSCGKDFGSDDLENSEGVILLSLTLRSEPDDPKRNEILKSQIGVYQLDREYHICFECVLKAMGVKP